MATFFDRNIKKIVPKKEEFKWQSRKFWIFWAKIQQNPYTVKAKTLLRKKLNCISNLFCRFNFPQKYEKELIYNYKIN